MITQMAPCGLDCAQCEAYQATQSNDRSGLEKLAEKWRKEFNSPEITADGLLCDGCRTGGRTIVYCQQCGIRKCAIERNLATCAVCTDYACEKLEGFLKDAPKARVNLEALRKT